MAQILIVGGSGTVGSEIVKTLKAEGHSVRVATSKPTTEAGKMHVNLLTGDGLDAAFEGVERAFFLSPGGYADQYAILAPLIAKAKEAKLKKVVLMTALGVEGAEGSPMRRAELDLIASGIPYNIIRPSWFSQNFVNFWGYGIKTANTIALPVGDGKAAFIDSRDISAVAAKLLTDDSRNGQEYTLTGPQALTHTEVAKIIADATGKPVTFKDISPDELRPVLVGAGIPADYVELLLVLLSYIKAGYTGAVTNSVEEILGRKPRDFRSYAKEAADSWK
ncbi:MAG: NAD-dependent epimerase/dehydratase family protein [Fibrobacteria bacterium]|jgi:uncharacterized protein YbjT (DUF2867 family)|nr:NAD-dependent epimerase/dehydratase family protein [Fibrobacteria bacterium]